MTGLVVCMGVGLIARNKKSFEPLSYNFQIWLSHFESCPFLLLIIFNTFNSFLIHLILFINLKIQTKAELTFQCMGIKTQVCISVWALFKDIEILPVHCNYTWYCMSHDVCGKWEYSALLEGLRINFIFQCTTFWKNAAIHLFICTLICEPHI
jgi:hypothetical protein